MEKRKSSIKNIRRLTSDVLEFTLEFKEDFEFTAGQFFTIYFEKDGEEVRRFYSIASSPAAKHELVFIVRLLEGSERKASRYFERLKAGDELWIGEAAGYLTFRGNKKKILMVATGTGVTPFISILSQELKKSEYSFSLYFGLRHVQDIFYQKLLRSWQTKYKNFDYEICLSQPENDTWQGATGRVTERVRKLTDLAEYEVYLCGKPEMVKELRSYLTEQGLGSDQLYFEAY